MDIPSGERLHSYGKSPCLMGKLNYQSAIFKSYVSLPEGTGFMCGFIGKTNTPIFVGWLMVLLYLTLILLNIIRLVEYLSR